LGQINDLPEAYVKKKEILQNLAGRVGKFLKIDTEGQAGGNSVRVRVELDVNKPLVRFKPRWFAKDRAKFNYLVKYEKVPKFCEVCGILGHEFMECGTCFHAPENHVIGEWLIADNNRRGRGHGQAGGAGSRGARGARGHGFERGMDNYQGGN
jgi:hypothetical protein